MASQVGPSKGPELTSLRELADLQRANLWQRLRAILLPFLWCGAYFVFAERGWWVMAVSSLVALSFVTYGSTSHDLVHRNLGLPKRLNDLLLSAVELLALRSGHAYQAAHLYHHARYPHADDVESLAARGSLAGAIAEGLIFQFRIYLWALRHASQVRGWVIGEGIGCFVFAGLAMLTPALRVYAVLMVMSSWLIPLMTSYIPHDPRGPNELSQTRMFRGLVASILAVEHLYHLEHHLYPSVPHCNWPRLAARLDPFLNAAGVKPVRIWF